MTRALVVPSVSWVRLEKFMESLRWAHPLRGDDVLYVVCDAAEPFYSTEDKCVRVYSWEDIDRELGDDAWIIPRRSDAIRSFGFLKALESQADLIVTLDDDCYQGNGQSILDGHAKRLTSHDHAPAWQSTLMGVRPRGLPYENRERRALPVVNVGLWRNSPDVDAHTQLAMQRQENDTPWTTLEGVVARGIYIPMCGMNLGFWPRTIVSAMYFLLMGRDRDGVAFPYDRFGDIWCGVMVKKILDHHQLDMTFGEPIVTHQRASNPWSNLRKESSALIANEYFWEYIDEIELRDGTIADNYLELADAVCDFPISLDLPQDERAYWRRLSQAMKIWIKLTALRL